MVSQFKSGEVSRKTVAGAITRVTTQGLGLRLLTIWAQHLSVEVVLLLLFTRHEQEDVTNHNSVIGSRVIVVVFIYSMSFYSFSPLLPRDRHISFVLNYHS